MNDEQTTPQGTDTPAADDTTPAPAEGGDQGSTPAPAAGGESTEAPAAEGETPAA